MLKLPLCPYCGAEFLYRDVKKTMWRKNRGCPHCGKHVRISKKGVLLLFFTAVFLLVGCNVLLLRIESMNLLFLTGFTAGGLAGFFLTVPFAIRYRPL